MFFSQAWAQTAEQVAATASNPAMADGMRIWIQLIIIFVIFYLFLIRPQQKRIKQHNQMIDAVSEGAIIIVGGIQGKVVKVLNDRELLVEIADGVKVKALRGFISEVVLTGDEAKPLPKESKGSK